VAQGDANFKQIVILPSHESSLNVVVMVWNTPPVNLTSQAMHKAVKQSINNIKEQSEEVGVS